MVAHHGALLESGALGTLKGHPAAVAVAQVVNLEKNSQKGYLDNVHNEVRAFASGPV